MTNKPSNMAPDRNQARSEEHTSELQSQSNLECRLLLEKNIAGEIDRVGRRSELVVDDEQLARPGLELGHQLLDEFLVLVRTPAHHPACAADEMAAAILR